MAKLTSQDQWIIGIASLAVGIIGLFEYNAHKAAAAVVAPNVKSGHQGRARSKHGKRPADDVGGPIE